MTAYQLSKDPNFEIHLYDHKPSLGRKFLIAGKSGLNLTNSESFPSFLDNYSAQNEELPAHFYKALNNFTNDDLRQWVKEDFGIETIDRSSGKVFPKEMKAAPLLRRLIAALRENGVQIHANHRWTDLKGSILSFQQVKTGEMIQHPTDQTILALGGASWPQTGSDGHWGDILKNHGIEIETLTPAPAQKHPPQSRRAPQRR